MFKSIDADEIEKILKEEGRQYLVGDLKRPQKIKHIVKEDIEVGISHYNEDGGKLPHYHSVVSEYQYVISGLTEYLDVDTGEVFRYKKGVFYLIETGTTYAQRSKAGTTILFIKTPSINDKHKVEASEETVNWLNDEKFYNTLKEES